MFLSRFAAVVRWLLVAGFALASFDAAAQQITRYARLTGNINFVATGGSLRTDSNDGDYCNVGTSSSAALTGVPAGATIRAA